MKTLTILLLLLLTTVAHPCSIAPKGLIEEPRSLVRNTNTIVLAKAVSFVPDEFSSLYAATVTFEPVRFLKGRHRGEIEVIGQVVTGDQPAPNDFDGHRDPVFWAFYVGNSGTPGDCLAYGVFHIGETYLLFLRPQSNFKSFENIQSPDDFWLTVVERIVAGWSSEIDDD